MANGVLASYQSATTKYTNAYVDPASNPNGLVRADFPMYTTPSATLTSGSLRMMNNTGATATVDVAIQDYTEQIEFAAPGSQSPTVSNFSEFNFVPNSKVTSSYIIISSHNGTNYVPGETITITGSGHTGTQDAKVIAWDAANLKIWYEQPNGSWPTTIASMTATGAGGGTGTITDSYVGTSGRVVFYDRLNGHLLFQNDALVNNVKSLYYTEPNNQMVSGIGGAGQLSVSSRALEWLPSLATVKLYNGSSGDSGTNVTAEWKMNTGTYPEIVISGVSYSNDQNKILKSYPIPNNSEVSLTGLVLEQWQNLYVSASAGVAFNFIGFEESVTIS